MLLCALAHLPESESQGLSWLSPRIHRASCLLSRRGCNVCKVARGQGHLELSSKKGGLAWQLQEWVLEF